MTVMVRVKYQRPSATRGARLRINIDGQASGASVVAYPYELSGDPVAAQPALNYLNDTQPIGPWRVTHVLAPAGCDFWLVLAEVDA